MAISSLSRRAALLAGLSLVLLSGCVQPLVDAETQQKLVVGKVTVDVSAIQPIGGGREITLTRQQIERDLTRALSAQMIRPGQGRPNARVAVKVDEIWLVSRGQSFITGGKSTIRGTITVTDLASGKQILPQTEVFGMNEGFRLNGVIGALTAPEPQKDYEGTVEGFAHQVAVRLLGEPAKPAKGQ